MHSCLWNEKPTCDHRTVVVIGSRVGLGASLLTALKFVNVIVGAIEIPLGMRLW